MLSIPGPKAGELKKSKFRVNRENRRSHILFDCTSKNHFNIIIHFELPKLLVVSGPVFESDTPIL
jgi:hypothetical protein